MKVRHLMQFVCYSFTLNHEIHFNTLELILMDSEGKLRGHVTKAISGNVLNLADNQLSSNTTCNRIISFTISVQCKFYEI